MKKKAEHDALVEALAAGIAHEVRNPLNAIQLNIEILAQEIAELVPNKDARVYSVLATLAGELRSLDDFVSEFLRYARPPRLKLERVPVRELLTDLGTFFTPECGRRGVTLALELDDEGPATIVADGFQLKHAVLNLLLNGLQASRAGGTVRLRSRVEKEALQLQVVDGGEGMSAERRAKIFELFFTTREGGTGLGLPIVRRIVEAHGGAVSVESAPGKGTTATLTLPLQARVVVA